MAGGLSQMYGPRVIFAVMAVMVVVAIALLPTVKAPAALSQDEPEVELEAVASAERTGLLRPLEPSGD